MVVLALVAVLICTNIIARCDGAAGVLRDSRLGMAGVSEAFSHRDGDNTLYSSDNYLKCTSDHFVTPRSTAEVSSLIKQLVLINSSTSTSSGRVKIRATRRGFHSSAGFVCAGERGSTRKEYCGEINDGKGARSSTVQSFTVLLHMMNGVVDVDESRCRMTVEAGMTLLELARGMEAAGMSIPAGALSIYANLTVGGVILASAHGSGFGTVSSLGDLVRKVKWVNAKGDVIVSDSETEHGANEVRALVGGLGLLGIATEFTLQMQPNSRTVVETRKKLKDTNIVAELKQIVEVETPHVLAFWRPDFGTYKLVLWTQVEKFSAPAPRFYPNASIVYLTQIEEKLSSVWSELMQMWEEDAADESANAGALNADVCTLAETMHDVSMFQDATSGTLIEHGTIPTNSAMVSEDCSPTCFFHTHHMGTITEDTEFTIKLTQLEDWVQDVKRIVPSITEFNNKGLITCMPPGYFWIRFGNSNNNLLSTSTGSEPVAYVQWTHLRSGMLPNKLPKQSSILEAIEQLTLCKYKGRPHWGKNYERIFTHPKCKVRDNFPAENIARLLAMQEQHDPGKVFEPELFGNLLARRGPEYRDLCAAHLWCYCQDDSHCPNGYVCRSSSGFPEYKVCKLVVEADHSPTHQQESVDVEL